MAKLPGFYFLIGSMNPNDKHDKQSLLMYLIVFLLSINIGLFIGHKSTTRNEVSTTINESVNAQFLNSQTINKIYQDALNYLVEIHVKSTKLKFIPFTSIPNPKLMAQESLGSGILISSDGYILTNAHVVKNANSIEVTFKNDTTYEAKKIGEDVFTDIAVIKINRVNDKLAQIGNSSLVKAGDFVLAMGSPFGLSNSISFGIISAKNRNINYLKNHVELIQTDAGINQGNSGGPLLTLDGKVIGLNTITAYDRRLSFAIPINTAMESFSKIIKNGDVARPYLGMYMENKYPDFAVGQLPNAKALGGVIVTNVLKNGPADIAKLKTGDLIESINNKKINNILELRKIIQDMQPNDSVTLQIRNQNQLTNKIIILGKYPKFAN